MGRVQFLCWVGGLPRRAHAPSEKTAECTEREVQWPEHPSLGGAVPLEAQRRGPREGGGCSCWPRGGPQVLWPSRRLFLLVAASWFSSRQGRICPQVNCKCSSLFQTRAATRLPCGYSPALERPQGSRVRSKARAGALPLTREGLRGSPTFPLSCLGEGAAGSAQPGPGEADSAEHGRKDRRLMTLSDAQQNPRPSPPEFSAS